MGNVFRTVLAVLACIAVLSFLYNNPLLFQLGPQMVTRSTANCAGADGMTSSTRTSTPSVFDQLVAQSRAYAQDDAPGNTTIRPKFSLNGWRRGTGGLDDKDRLKLGELYGAANSVFEYGLGESTLIANAVGVPRYAGIDSDAVWVAKSRDKVAKHFRFYLGDVGPTRDYGHPKDVPFHKKAILQYQLAPLMLEDQAFDVYMVDGRWRLASMLASFLHASSRGAPHADTIVLIHDSYVDKKFDDLYREQYSKADFLLDRIDHSGTALSVYKRKANTTDADLKDIWDKEFEKTQ